jgi:3-phosphoshikimate 1-carboxyvinyltransferase
MQINLERPRKFMADISPPGDKSIAHRALLLNSLGTGKSRISYFPRGQDTLATLNTLVSLGVNIKEENRSENGFFSTLNLEATGISGLHDPETVLDAKNSGTLFRLLLGLLAGSKVKATMTGDESLRTRPMGRIIEPLKLMGANIFGKDEGSFPPVTVIGANLHGISYQMQIASAQLKSAILIAGLSSEGETVIEEPTPTRNHTENMLINMGASLIRKKDEIHLKPGELHNIDINIPADISSAAPWLVAGLIHRNAKVTLRNVGVNPTRTGILDVLSDMGGDIKIDYTTTVDSEPVADITVQSSELKGIEISGDIIPRLIDELPLIAVAATQAKGNTVIKDAAELRVKESDRIENTVEALRILGARVEAEHDGMVISGNGSLQGGKVHSSYDHRMAMAFAVCSLVSDKDVFIENADVTDVSYPGFWDDFLGAFRD